MQPLPFDGMGEMYARSLNDWATFQRSTAFVKAMGGRRYSPLNLSLSRFSSTERSDDATDSMEGEVGVMLGYDCLILERL